MIDAAWRRFVGGRIARILAVARVEFLHLIRDRTTIGLVVAVPAIQVALFGYAVNLNPTALPIAIARDHARPADQLRHAVEETGYFSIRADGLEAGSAERMVVEGKVLVAIELPRHSVTPRTDAPSQRPRIVVDATDAAAVIGVARLLFDLPVAGNLAALLAAVPLYAAAHLILGFAFSAVAESQMQAIQGAVFFYLPSMLLSGFMFPFQGMPTWAQTMGNALPLTHFVRATRGVLLRGEGAS